MLSVTVAALTPSPLSPKITRFCTVLSITLSVLFVVRCFGNWGSNQILFAEDQALSFAVGQAISEGEFPLAGPPSRIGGRHPGEGYYYVMWLLLTIAAGNETVALFFISLLTLLSFLVMFRVLIRLSPRTIVPFTVLAFMLCAHCGLGVFMVQVPWQNHLVALPMALFCLSVVTVLSRGLHSYPLVFLSGTGAVHFHFSTAPLVGLISAGTLVLALVTHRKKQARRWWESKSTQACSILIACATWIPPLVYELRHHGLTELWRALHAPHKHAGLKQAILLILQSIVNTIWYLPSFISMHMVHLLGVIVGGMLCALVPVLFHFDKKDIPTTPAPNVSIINASILKQCGILFLGGVVLYALLLSRQEPPLSMFYFTNSFFPLLLVGVSLLLGSGLALIVYLIDRYVVQRQHHSKGMLASFVYLFQFGFSGEVRPGKTKLEQVCVVPPGVFAPRKIYRFLQILNSWKNQSGSGIIALGALILLLTAALVRMRWPNESSLTHFHSLRHAEQMAEVIAHDTPSSEAVELFVKDQARIMGDSYLYFLGPRSRSGIHYAEQLKELSSFQKKTVRTRGYLIACPYPTRKAMKRWLRGLRPKWKIEGPVGLQECSECRECAMIRLRLSKTIKES